MINHRYPVPFLPVSGEVVDSLSTNLRFADLRAMAGTVSVGIYDAETKAIATASGNGRKFFIGSSSEHTIDKLDTFLFGATLPKGDPYWTFKGDDVLSFEYSDPTDVIHEEWALGYSGSVGCNLKTPKFECDRMYGIRITVGGNEVMKRWNSTQTFDIYSDVICCDSDICTTGCQDTNIDCEWVMKNIAEKANIHPDLKAFNVKVRYITNDYAAPAVSALTKYRIVVTDDGSNHALGLIQRTSPLGTTVVRTNRAGLISTYEICSATAPTAFTPEALFALPDNCDVCPVGSTTIAGKDVYTVIRALSETSTTSTVAEQTAFAIAVAADYVGSTASRFISKNAAVAVVEIEKAIGAAAPVAVKSDIITFSRTTKVQCDLVDPAAIAWASFGTAYREVRTLCITLQRQNCSLGNRLAELVAYYANRTDMVPASLTLVAGTACEDSYTVQQYSIGCMEDACLAADTATYADFGGYAGQLWELQAPAPAIYDAAKRCGLRISATATPKFVDDCEFTLGDHPILEPVKLEVSWIVDDLVGDQGKVCDWKVFASKRITKGNVARQSGYAVLIQYIKSSAYDAFGQDWESPRLRRVFDSNLRKQVNRSVFYRLYYLQFKVLRGNINFHQVPEVAEAVFAVPMNRLDKAMKLERAVLSPLARFGVILKKRVDGPNQ